MRFEKLRARLWLGGLGLVWSVGCAPAATPNDHGQGQVSLGLNLAGNVSVASIHYLLSGALGYQLSGDIDLRATGRATLLVGGLPVGKGYRVALSALSTDRTVRCQGAASFDVTRGATSGVDVEVSCDAADAATSLTFDVCPVLLGTWSSAASARVGGTISVAAAVTPAKGLETTGKWSIDNRDVASIAAGEATGDGGVSDGGASDAGGDGGASDAGAVSQPTHRATVTCKATGSAKAKLTVFAGSCPMLTAELPVTCVAPGSDAGAKLDICPTIASYAIGGPFFRQPVGQPLPLSVLATDDDGDTLTYAWRVKGAAIGTLTGATNAQATFTCTAVGNTEVSLFVSDGICVTARDPAVPVTCIAP